MPFQQLGFNPYPRNPRRDVSGYQNMGRGFAETGAGAEQMLGSFQEMKERRQRNLLSTYTCIVRTICILQPIFLVHC